MKNNAELQVRNLLRKKKIMRYAYRAVYCFFRVVLLPARLVGALSHQADFAANMMVPFCEAAENSSNCFVTCHIRPKEAEEVLPVIYHSAIEREIAIVMQGPIKKEDDFTVETVKIYSRIFPGAKVFVSTWEDEDAKSIRLLKALENCCVILNKKPAHGGIGNRNFQIVGTIAGIMAAEQEGKKYILKTRSDVRICNPEFLQKMYRLVHEYPCQDTKSIGQKMRLVVFNAFVFQPYYFSDFYGFGYLEDMKRFWNSTQEAQDDPKGAHNLIANTIVAEHWSYRKIFESRIGTEIEIPADYFRRMTGSAECSLKEWWDILRNYFIALAHTESDFLWLKYDYNREENMIYNTFRRKLYGADDLMDRTLGLESWFSLMRNTDWLQPERYEYLLDE